MSIFYQLPDGAELAFDAPASGQEIAERISKKLAKQALAIRVNGELRDLYLTVPEGAQVQVITRADEDGLELLRHDAAHIMAEAVQELFPDTQVTIGPTIEDGFYYDFHRNEPFTPEHLEQIEQRMQEIVRRNEPIRREVWDRDEAIRFFLEQGEQFKAEIIRDLPADEEVSLYRQGEFIDLCRGPHLPSTSKLGDAFKVMKVAGAYWRGDSNNPQLQRIYGTAWRDKKELRAYLQRLEEAEKRDHRRLGRQMGLFHFQEEAPGAVFWHPKGWRLFRTLLEYMRERQERAGYVEISTPSVMDRGLWETSGHWESFGHAMYTTETEDGRCFALKPMNCPGGIQVYAKTLHSYRELPLRMAEFGKVNRYEPSGALHGLMRVREFTQDDAHIFCTPEQMEQECHTVIELIMDIYRQFGFDDVRVKFSDRPETRIGSNAVWDQLEHALKGALESSGYDYTLNPGEGAFYGPKLEFVLRDAIGRDWQCGTLQVDMNLPERFDISYIGKDSQRHRPVMLHRALFGSLERFTGILIEHHAGRLPMWLAPVPVVIATITNAVDDYAREVLEALRARGIRAELDLRNEKISYKVREHSNAKIPAIVVLGEKEAEGRQLALRRLGSKDTATLALDEALDQLAAEVQPPL